MDFTNSVQYHYDQFPPKNLDYGKIVHSLLKATDALLDQKTVGEVAEKMRRENYLKSRTNPSTFNKAEIENILVEWFCKEFDLDKKDLNRESKFGLE